MQVQKPYSSWAIVQAHSSSLTMHADLQAEVWPVGYARAHVLTDACRTCYVYRRNIGNYFIVYLEELRCITAVLPFAR